VHPTSCELASVGVLLRLLLLLVTIRSSLQVSTRSPNRFLDDRIASNTPFGNKTLDICSDPQGKSHQKMTAPTDAQWSALNKCVQSVFARADAGTVL
jgi:hypothetical protein